MKKELNYEILRDSGKTTSTKISKFQFRTITNPAKVFKDQPRKTSYNQKNSQKPE
ncbi:MAG: hypothetical protein MJB14_09015 [Spirochaetes bacterium]|nr:hypothetical protein [Spirochaetota bacterium]